MNNSEKLNNIINQKIQEMEEGIVQNAKGDLNSSMNGDNYVFEAPSTDATLRFNSNGTIHTSYDQSEGDVVPSTWVTTGSGWQGASYYTATITNWSQNNSPSGVYEPGGNGTYSIPMEISVYLTDYDDPTAWIDGTCKLTNTTTGATVTFTFDMWADAL